MIKNMNSKMATNYHNYQQLNLTPPHPQLKPTKRTTRTGTESQKWRSHGGREKGENGIKVTESKKRKW